MRWSEEVLLLREEMRRVLVFLEWQATWWEKRAVLHVEWWAEQDGLASCPECDPAGLRRPQPSEAEGMAAYAHRQAYIRRKIRSSFLLLWDGAPEFTEIGLGATNDILDLNLTASLSLFDLPSISQS